MTLTITLSELISMGISTWSVKDDSVRGCSTKYTSEVKIGDKVVIDNYFTLVIDEPNPSEDGLPDTSRNA